ncbi:MAG: beta-CASP ribonuclease aCPSF1 [Halobacteria archaeon]|nr:beta-CASP ribonuclease aCPSF1 [Halobacteria archaeon]
MNAQDELEDIKRQIEKELPAGVGVSNVEYEGPELVIYTSDPKKFAHDGDLVRQLARKLRKRITVRPDPSVLAEPETTRDEIEDIVPDEAGITDYEFNPDLGEITIKAKKPGLVIGKNGSTLREITRATGWTPDVVRTPPIESRTVRDIRRYLRHESDDRKEFLRKTGRRIHRDTTSDEEWVRVTSLGCCREVGRASFILSTPETRVLIDCGDKPGTDESPHLEVPEANPLNQLDAVVLTHAHLDHSALIPLLYKYGYDGPVYMTPPTRDLMGLLQQDYLDVAAKEGRTPPYTSEMAREAIKHSITLEYGDVTDIAPDIKLTFHNAGHILGSAVAHFHIGDGLYNVGFSGDIHYKDTRLFNGAVNDFPRLETLFLESTYGGRNDIQPSRDEAEKKLKNVIKRTADRGGKVLIPAFSVGRSQELMVVLEEAMRNGDIPEMPVYLDGMIWEATAIHTAHPEYLNDDLRDRIFHEDENPFLADYFEQVDEGTEQRQEIRDGDPAIVLATNGMMAGGPVMEHLQFLAPDDENSLVFVGYQAAGTTGHSIQSGRDEVHVSGGKGRSDTVKINLEVTTVEGFSGHADRDGLVKFVETMNPRPEKIFTVHGDESNTKDLASSLYKKFNMRTISPMNLETYRFI